MDFFSPLAFGAGMVALINPCGFALLPAYLGMFLNQKDDSSSRLIALNRAQGVGLALSLGILAVFAVIGVAFGALQSGLAEILPFFTVLLGVGLVILAVRMLFFGYELKLELPKLNKGGASGSFVQMFLFGVSYALASLTCTIGIFISVAGLSQTSTTGFASSFGAVLSYGIGMGLLATVLTLLMALGKRGLVNKFRSVLPKINFISGLILLVVGPYMVLYGLWELQLFNIPWPFTETAVFAADWAWLDAILVRASEIQTWLNGLLDRQVNILGWETRLTNALGWPFLAINLALIVAGFVARMNRDRSIADMPEMDDDAEVAEPVVV